MDFGLSASLTRALSLLAKLATATLLVVILSRARPLLMPIAFAAALAFILTSPMKWLQHRISRLPALALVMLLAVGTLGSAGYVLATQLNELTTHLGKYTESMRRKVATLQVRGGGPLARVEVMMARISDGLQKKVDSDAISVHVVPAEISPAAHMWNLAKPLAEPLITVLFVLVLCIFMLGQRDESVRGSGSTSHACLPSKGAGLRGAALPPRTRPIVGLWIGHRLGRPSSVPPRRWVTHGPI